MKAITNMVKNMVVDATGMPQVMSMLEAGQKVYRMVLESTPTLMVKFIVVNTAQDNGMARENIFE